MTLVTLKELQALELKTITALRTDGTLGRLGTLQSAAWGAQIVRAPNSSIDVHLSFTLPTRLREDAGTSVVERPFHVGCLAIGKNDVISQLTYSVMIGEVAYPSKKVARKFHFDFEPVMNRNLAESKPTYHMQMCGELSPHHINAGYAETDIEHLLPAWSQPRVPAQPTSLALVLNWLFIEFGAEAVVKAARLSPAWRSIVRETERSVLKPYFDSCAGFFSSHANNDKSFVAEHIYQES